MKSQNKKLKNDKIRLMAIIVLSLLIITTGNLYSINAFIKGNNAGAILGVIIAILIFAFALFVFIRGNKDLKKGFTLKDERSRKVIEKASSMAFYVSLYLLLGVGFLSDDIVKFRDVSQATGVAVGGMALLFLIFWLYYNKKAI